MPSFGYLRMRQISATNHMERGVEPMTAPSTPPQPKPGILRTLAAYAKALWYIATHKPGDPGLR